MGVNVRWGYAGELDLGFCIFPAIGAYVYGVVVLPKANGLASVSYVLGLNQFIVGVLAAAVAGGLPQPFGGVWALSPDNFATFFLVLCLVITVYLVLEMIRRSPFGLAVRCPGGRGTGPAN